MILALFAIMLPLAFASPEEDAARLGAYYTNIAIYRTGSRNNVVTVGLGDPEQTLNLTLCTCAYSGCERGEEGLMGAATNVDFVLAVSNQCVDCVQEAERYVSCVPHLFNFVLSLSLWPKAYDVRYTPADSRTVTGSQRALSASAIYPTSDGSIDTLLLNGNLVTERITDPRQDSYDRVIGVINQVEEMTEVAEQGRAGTLPDGVSGFFGLGVYQVRIPSQLVGECRLTGCRRTSSGLLCRAWYRSTEEAHRQDPRATW